MHKAILPLMAVVVVVFLVMVAMDRDTSQAPAPQSAGETAPTTPRLTPPRVLPAQNAPTKALPKAAAPAQKQEIKVIVPSGAHPEHLEAWARADKPTFFVLCRRDSVGISIYGGVVVKAAGCVAECAIDHCLMGYGDSYPPPSAIHFTEGQTRVLLSGGIYWAVAPGDAPAIE